MPFQLSSARTESLDKPSFCEMVNEKGLIADDNTVKGWFTFCWHAAEKFGSLQGGAGAVEVRALVHKCFVADVLRRETKMLRVDTNE